ncbi:hypothetical protein CK203_090341 [Vitis vinifera]|uniref:Uncharacterized protein n=1 Tax=Vitis vinifera TaxID=29760 RepID=A0A438EI53_VITVI|nr:hypothetical protein CK203_090341 [Vitis vinifera]
MLPSSIVLNGGWTGLLRTSDMMLANFYHEVALVGQTDTFLCMQFPTAGTSSPMSNKMKNPENQTNSNGRDATPGSDLWTDGLICAFEYVTSHRRISRSKYGSKIQSVQQIEGENMKKQVPENKVSRASAQNLIRKHRSESASLVELEPDHVASLDNHIDHQFYQSDRYHMTERSSGSHWVPIGWARISELVQTVRVDAGWALQQFEVTDDEDERSAADLAAPYWSSLQDLYGGAMWLQVTGLLTHGSAMLNGYILLSELLCEMKVD